ncbi:energy transducer TonB [Frateuria terrea]|uniref:Protein TonB n=1 Tax=Frateuria terrea TaxID=529704 RepID=A0A1H6VEN7_9GAMM|nr:energy transducer TonB [Frateuria terrea]SEJ02286.1 protein TonB [Frateuria terrea]SFP64591.1 protein TonB [Frateuria terrea]
MSSATLASPRTHAHPDPVRISALSAALAINLTVFIAATRPLPPPALLLAMPDLGVRLIEEPKPRPLPPPPPPPPIDVRPLTRPTHLPTIAPPVATAPPATDEGRVAAPTIHLPTSAPSDTDAAPPATLPGPPVEASLAYRSAPLAFPPQAVRQHMHGTVLLRVLVDEGGKPVQAVVEQSSGYKLLDRSAQEQVLARWRFQPASVGGRTVRAWARIPVSFELRQL